MIWHICRFNKSKLELIMEKVVLFFRCTYDAILFCKLHQWNVCCYSAHTDNWIETFTTLMFSGVLVVRGQWVDILFNANSVALKLETHYKIVFRVGTESCQPNPKWTWNVLYIAVMDLFFINVSTMKT